MDGFTSLRAERFDVVVSDVEMPRLNGFDLTARIRADRSLAETASDPGDGARITRRSRTRHRRRAPTPIWSRATSTRATCSKHCDASSECRMQTGQKIKVLVVDDSPVTRALVVHLLDAEPDLEVIGTVNDGQAALDFLASGGDRPDVDRHGHPHAATRRLRGDAPDHGDATAADRHLHGHGRSAGAGDRLPIHGGRRRGVRRKARFHRARRLREPLGQISCRRCA